MVYLLSKEPFAETIRTANLMEVFPFLFFQILNDFSKLIWLKIFRNNFLPVIKKEKSWRTLNIVQRMVTTMNIFSPENINPFQLMPPDIPFPSGH